MGRHAELLAVRDLFAQGARLVTLLGPPGTGKTRLAIELASQERSAFADLTAATTLGDIAATVASVLGVRVRVDGKTLVEKIGELLQGEDLLLVLDNFEQIVEHAPSTISRWLSHGARMCVTSRELLRVAGEHAFELPPLACPAPDAESDAIRDTDAVRLLLLYAPRWEPREEELLSLAAIARRLDGIPLALELAGSRLPLLGADALAARLEKGLGELGPSRRDANARQATLRNAIEWSWRLLSEPEREGLARLSIFRGEFSADAALAALSRHDAVPILEALRDKSLVARAGADGRRFRLLESVREFATEHLRDDEAALRVARFFAEQADRRAQALGGKGARAALAWLALERDSILAAHDAIADRPDAADVRGELLLALDPLVARVGPSGLHLPRLDAALTRPLLPALAARLHVARARVRRDRGEMDACVADLEAARDLSDAQAPIAVELGEAFLAQGRFEDAARTLASALADASGDRAAEQRAHAVLGLVHHGRGRLAEAEEHYARALDLALDLSDSHAEARARRDLGNLFLSRGERERARAYYEEALRAGDDLRLEGVVRGNLAILDQEEGRLEDALAHMRRALACLRAVGDRPFEAHLLGYLGNLHHERGQLDAAQAAYGRALETLAEVRDVRLAGVFYAARAAVRARAKKKGDAQNDLALAARRLAEVGDPALDALLLVTRAQLELAEAADPASEAQAARRARQAIESVSEHARASDDVRFAVRMLERALPAEAILVGPSSRWFRVPRCDTVSLERRPTLARLLDALVDARIATPGVEIEPETLVAAGWPGERIMETAARNRLRVALTTLRNLGLRAALITHERGHLLDPNVPVHRQNE